MPEFRRTSLNFVASLTNREFSCECEETEDAMKTTPGLSPPANYTDRATAVCRRS
jgi:hypothetical protein